MTKQEFLAMSLPYGLKMYMEDLKGNIEIPFKLRPEWLENALEFGNKPILHPLSDLTKEIEHNGERFVPIEKIRKCLVREWCDVYDQAIECIFETDDKTKGDKILKTPYEMLKYLVEWHFDIAGLIEKGEAIDVNTLTENPYKETL